MFNLPTCLGRQFTIKYLILILIFVLFPGDVFAALPSDVTGNAYVQLPTGERLPLEGVKVYRTDFDSYEYCEGANKCFGTRHGVQVYTDSLGKYFMGNEKSSFSSCFQQFPEGLKYACVAGTLNSSVSPENEEVSECYRDIQKNYSNLYSQNLNWCGFSGMNNPHRWEPAFAEDYKLPGNLANLGYSHTAGSWKTLDPNDPNRLLDQPYYEESIATAINMFRKDFIFVLDPVAEIEVNIIEPLEGSSKDYVGCKSLVGIASKDGVEYTLSEIPEEFDGNLLLTCIAETKGTGASRIDFTFEKSVDGVQTVESVSVYKEDLVLLSDCKKDHQCYSATAEFSISGVGGYKVDSRICNENNLCSK